MEFRILGPLEVVADERQLTPHRPKQRLLLAALLLRQNEVVSADELLELLWDDAPPETARTALHGHVSELRKVLGRKIIRTQAPGYALLVEPERIDLRRFEALAEEARREDDLRRRGELLRSGLSLFRGEALSDFRYQAFARAEAARIEELRLWALEERIEADLALGRSADLVPELESLVASTPLRERLRGELMLGLYRSGRHADALEVFREGRRILAEELGLEPGPALRDLEQQMLTHDASLTLRQHAAVDRPEGGRRERKLVSVVVCSLLDYSGEGGLDPEDADALIEARLTAVREQVEPLGGTVEELAGGAVLAAFGAPAVHEDDAERAVRAALAVRDALCDELDLRIGVDTGEALVRVVGETGAAHPGVVGELVQSAWRVHEAAPSDGVVVGARTHRASEHAIVYRAVELAAMPGRREPRLVWEALEARSEPEHRRPSAGVVGRERELARLADTLGRAGTERTTQLVTLIGPPGIGKTRLLRELFALAEREPDEVSWLQGRSLPFGNGVTFWALGEIVKARAGVFEGDPTETVEQKLRIVVTATLGEGREGERVLAHLRRLVGLGGDETLGEDRRDEAFAAWRLFFESLAEESPLVLAIEDLQWADDGLLDFLDELAGESTDVPLLVIVTSRPELFERRPQWAGGKRNALTVSLAPLSEADTQVLLTELLGDEADPDLVERVQGIPLFAEEYARLVLEEGRVDNLPLPESLQALIAARLDALPVVEKGLVQDAAVLGELAWAGAISAVGGRERGVVEELAGGLERKGFLGRRRRSSVEGEVEYAFHHVLVRDVAYGQIPRAQRADMHRLAAEWIESLGRRDDHVELLAHHYVTAVELVRATHGDAGNLERQARLALRDAGNRAATLGGLPAAVRFYRRALELWPDDDPGHGMLLLRLGRARLFAEAAGEEELRAAADHLLAEGDRLHAGEALALLLTLHQEHGYGELVRQYLERAGALVAELPPSREKAEILAELCRSRMMSEDNDEAVRLGRDALRVCDALGLDDVRAAVLISVGSARWDIEPETGRADIERGIALASSIDSHEAARGYGNMASFLMDNAELVASYAARRAGLEIAERLGLHWYVRWLRIEELAELYYTTAEWDELLERAGRLIRERTILATRAHELGIRVRLARGNLDDALRDSAVLLELARGAREPQAIASSLAVVALAQLRAGRREECASLVDETIEVVARGSPKTLFIVAPLLGDQLHSLGRGPALGALADGVKRGSPWLDAGLASAAGHFARSAEIFERIGAQPDEAWARLRDGTALTEAGRGIEAEDQLERALAYFESVGATAYAAEARALLVPGPSEPIHHQPEPSRGNGPGPRRL